MGRRTIILIVAFLIAGIGASLVFLYVNSVDERAQAGAELVEVMTVTAPVAAGESVADAQAAGKFALSPVTGTEVLAGALTDTSSLGEQVALTPLYVGEQVVAAKFGQVGSQSRITIPEEMMAVSVDLGDPQRVAGFISPGSKVAVFSTLTPAADATAAASAKVLAPRTRLLLEDVQVIGVGETGITSTTTTTPTGAETTATIPTTILTLALPQADAERVILAASQTELSLGLLTDKTPLKASAGVDLDTLFSEN